MLFCIGIYLVALFFSIFICSAIFKAVNGRKSASIQTVKPLTPASQSNNLVALR